MIVFFSLKVHNFCFERPLSLLAPGAKKNLATPLVSDISSGKKVVEIPTFGSESKTASLKLVK